MARALGSYPGCRWFKSDCRYHFGPLVKRLRHRPFTAESWVRFPYGSPASNLANGFIKPFARFLFFGKTPVVPYLVFIAIFLVFTQGERSFRRPAFSFCQRTALLRLPDLSSPVLLGTYDSKCCSSLKLERVLNRPIPPPHQLLRL